MRTLTDPGSDMANSKAEMIVHPIRLRIIEALHGRELTSRQIADSLDDVPQATLYRRRKTQEIPYIRDNEGVIWYPVVELIQYYLKSREELRLPKTGRPRKF